MKSKLLIAAAGVAAALGAAPAALGQVTGPPPPKNPDSSAPVRKVSQEHAERLMQMPDISGVWNFTQISPKIHIAIFDPVGAVIPYEWSDDLPAFGPQPGSYMTTIPLKPERRTEYMQVVKNTAEGRSIDTFGACKPFGMPRLMAGAVGGFDLVQAPDVFIMHFPFYHEFRKIFMDGRSHPPAENDDGVDQRTWTGHSVGRWEGDTLVIDTVNMLPGFYDQTGARTSGKAHVVERLRLVDANTIENRITIEDPEMLTGPWVVTRHYVKSRPAAAGPRRSAYRSMNDQNCDPVDMSKGYQSVVLPQEQEAQKQAEPGR